MAANPFAPNQPPLPPYGGQQPQNVDQGQSQASDQQQEQKPTQQPATQERHPDLSRPPAQAGEYRKAPIWVDPNEWVTSQERLRTLEQFKREQDDKEELVQAERTRIMAEKGQIEEALKLARESSERKLKEAMERAKTIEQNWLNERRNTAIADALAGREYSGPDPNGTAKILRSILELEIEAVMAPNGEPIIRDRVTLRPATDYLKERLESPVLSVFFAPKNRGGSGSDGTRTPAPPVTGPPAAPPSPDQAISMWQRSGGVPDSFGMTRRRTGA